MRATASARIALEIVYPGQSPAPGIGFLVSSARSPGCHESLSLLSPSMIEDYLHGAPDFRCLDRAQPQQSGGSKFVRGK